MKKIIIAEDHPLFRTALKLTLKNIIGECHYLEASTINELQEIIDHTKNPDLILLDLHIPGAHGFSGLHFIQGQLPNCPIAVISANEDLKVMVKAMRTGAAAYIPKSASTEHLYSAINNVLHGKQWFTQEVKDALYDNKYITNDSFAEKISTLTSRQFKILGMISEGMLNKQIGYELNITEATVKAHITAIFKKLNVHNRTKALLALKSLEIHQNDSDAQT